MSPRVAAAWSGLGLAVGWNVSNLGAIAERLASDYGVALGTVGLFTTATFVTHAVLQIPAGRLVDARGARRVGFAALALLLASNAVALAAPEPSLVIAARAVGGIGTALGFLAGLDYVRAQGGSAFAQGLYGGTAMGGGGLALAVVPQLDGWLGWRAPFVSALVLAGLATLALVVAPPDPVRAVSAGSAQPARRPSGAPASLLRDARLYPLCVVFTASFGFAVIVGNWVVTLLERAGGYRQAVAGAIGSLVLLAGILGRPLGGWLSRRYPSRIRLLVAGCFATSAGGALLLLLAGSPAVTIVGALVVGVASGIPFAASFGAAVRVRPDAPAAAVGMVNMVANGAVVLGTPLLGFSFSLPGDGRVGFGVMAGLWLATALMVPSVRELDATRDGALPGRG